MIPGGKFFVFVGRVPILFAPLHIHYFHTIISYTLETGGHALFLAVDAECRADSEGFWRIETRAKSNSAVLPSKLEPFNRRQSVRDRALPLLFRIEYTPFYVATRPRSVDGKPASAISSCILNGLRLTSCLDLKINERPFIYVLFYKEMKKKSSARCDRIFRSNKREIVRVFEKKRICENNLLKHHRLHLIHKLQKNNNKEKIVRAARKSLDELTRMNSFVPRNLIELASALLGYPNIEYHPRKSLGQKLYMYNVYS